VFEDLAGSLGWISAQVKVLGWVAISDECVNEREWLKELVWLWLVVGGGGSGWSVVVVVCRSSGCQRTR
jgi:hypothetical protein